MTADASDDAAARGRAVFERLRSGVPSPSAGTDGGAPAGEGAASAPGAEGAPVAPPEDGSPEPPLGAVEAPSVDGPAQAAVEPGGVEGPAVVTAAAPASDAAGAEPPATAETPPAPVAEPTEAVGAGSGVVKEADPVLEALVAELDPAGAPSSPAWAPSPTTEEGPVTPPAVEAPPAPAGTVHPDPARFARPLPRVMAIANQKGGVGKTTTAVNLSAGLAEAGYRVLVIDLDPQGNASTGLGINIRDLQASMYDVLLRDVPLDDCIEATDVRNLFVAPANLDLAGAEIELVPAFSRELKLRRALEAVVADYDFVLIDCPPSLGLLTVNSLAAASEVLVPIQCEYYALEGLGQLMRNVGLVQKNLNPDLELSVIVCVMYDARTKLAEQVVREVRDHFGDTVCRTVVPRTVRLSEAPSYGQPIIAFDPSSRGAIAYRELAKEVSGGSSQRAR